MNIRIVLIFLKKEEGIKVFNKNEFIPDSERRQLNYEKKKNAKRKNH